MKNPETGDWKSVLTTALWRIAVLFVSVGLHGRLSASLGRVDAQNIRVTLRALALVALLWINFSTGVLGWMLDLLLFGATEHGLFAILLLLIGAVFSELVMGREDRRQALQKELRELRRVTALLRRHLEGRP